MFFACFSFSMNQISKLIKIGRKLRNKQSVCTKDKGAVKCQKSAVSAHNFNYHFPFMRKRRGRNHVCAFYNIFNSTMKTNTVICFKNIIVYGLRNTYNFCLLYTSDAADEEDSVDLGGRRIIKK